MKKKLLDVLLKIIIISILISLPVVIQVKANESREVVERRIPNEFT